MSSRRRTGAVIVAAVLVAGCEPRLPVQYLRQAAAAGVGETIITAPVEELLPGITENLPPPVPVDWDSIQARDTLKAILTFNSTGYFIYRGEPMGFEYDLLEAFAASHDLVLSTAVVRDRRLLFRSLNRGEGDVVAARLVAAPEYAEVVELTDPLYRSRPVVVQRAPGEGPLPDSAAGSADDTIEVGSGDAPPERVELRARLLQRPDELAGEEVHVPAGSDYYSRIVELSDSMGEAIELVEVEDAEQVEPLIEAVAAGRIRLTVSPENLAELTQARFTNIVATPVLGPPEPVVWAVRSSAPQLARELDRWLAVDSVQTLKEQLYVKYFVDRSAYRERVEDDLMASETGRISDYDSLLSTHAREIGWDWKLLAAQVAQESMFDPRARSWAGATGLLQLMPRTAREMGVTDPTDPENNVAGGVRYLEWLSGLWEDEITDEEERLKFILASYNAGRGHVLDAQRLAEKYGDDPTDWEDVAYWLLQKSKSRYYRDDVVQHGYVRGVEPVQYVSKILNRYERYRNVEE